MENDTMITKIKEKMTPTARIIGASFPVAASMVQLLNELESTQLKEHYRQVHDEFKEKLKELEEKVMEEKAKGISEVDPGELQHLLLLTLSKVMIEHREQKRKKFAEFFVKTSYMGKEITFDDKEFFLETLDELNESDLKLLKEIKNKGKLRSGDLLSQKVLAKKKDEELSKLIVSFNKLLNKGLIGKTGGHTGVIGYGVSPGSWQSEWINEWFEVLHVGKKFIESITISDILKNENPA
jgi:hypothetical protein